MAPVRAAIDRILAGHDPYPAVVVDGAWEMIAGEPRGAAADGGVAPHLLEPPVNVLRVLLHPEGVAPRIINLAEWRGAPARAAAAPDRADRRPGAGGAARRARDYPAPRRGRPDPGQAIAVPLRLRTPAGRAGLHLDGRDVRDGGRGHRRPSWRSSRSSRPTTRPRRRCASTSDAYLGRNRRASLRVKVRGSTSTNRGPPMSLRTALKLDAVVTGANGAAYLVAAGPLEDLLGLSPALLRGSARSCCCSPPRSGRSPRGGGLGVGRARGDRRQRPVGRRLGRVPAQRPLGPLRGRR